MEISETEDYAEDYKVSEELDRLIGKRLEDVEIEETPEAANDVKIILDNLRRGYGHSLDPYYRKLEFICKEKGIDISGFSSAFSIS
jgi:hypothetical protein